MSNKKEKLYLITESSMNVLKTAAQKLPQIDKEDVILFNGTLLGVVAGLVEVDVTVAVPEQEIKE